MSTPVLSPNRQRRPAEAPDLLAPRKRVHPEGRNHFRAHHRALTQDRLPSRKDRSHVHRVARGSKQLLHPRLSEARGSHARVRRATRKNPSHRYIELLLYRRRGPSPRQNYLSDRSACVTRDRHPPPRDIRAPGLPRDETPRKLRKNQSRDRRPRRCRNRGVAADRYPRGREADRYQRNLEADRDRRLELRGTKQLGVGAEAARDLLGGKHLI